jgi:hypothetical protein
LDFQNVISSTGPLPVQGTFNAESDAQMVIFVTGSVWASEPEQFVGVNVAVDGVNLGSCIIYCNEASSHRTFIPQMFTYIVPFGEHTITLSPTNVYTISDINDYFNVSILY